MARVTVEDCIEKVSNHFELVMLASQRARKIGTGAPLTVERDNDKNPVISLREIAAETVSTDELKEELIQNHQRFIQNDDSEDEVIDLMDGEEEWARMANQQAVEGSTASDATPAQPETTEAGEDNPSLDDMAGLPTEETTAT